MGFVKDLLANVFRQSADYQLGHSGKNEQEQTRSLFRYEAQDGKYSSGKSPAYIIHRSYTSEKRASQKKL